MSTIKQLKDFCKKQARLSYADYDQEGLRIDSNSIRRARFAAIKAAGMYWDFDDKALIPGEYFAGRLIITDKTIDYIPGQYAPTEIYWALEDYFSKTRGL